MSGEQQLKVVIAEHNEPHLAILQKYVKWLSEHPEDAGFRVDSNVRCLRSATEVKCFIERELAVDRSPPCDIILSDIYFPNTEVSSAGELKNETDVSPGEMLLDALTKREQQNSGERLPLLVFATGSRSEANSGFLLKYRKKEWWNSIEKPDDVSPTKVSEGLLTTRTWVTELVWIVRAYVTRPFPMCGLGVKEPGVHGSVPGWQMSELFSLLNECGYREVLRKLLELRTLESRVVLLQGEAGSGKHWLASYIHEKRRSIGGKRAKVRYPFERHIFDGKATNLDAHMFGQESPRVPEGWTTMGWITSAQDGTLNIDAVSSAHVPEFADLMMRYNMLNNSFSRSNGVIVHFNGYIILGDETAEPRSCGPSPLEKALGNLQFTKLQVPSLLECSNAVPKLAQGLLDLLLKGHRKTFDASAIEWLKRIPWKNNVVGLLRIVMIVAEGIQVDKISVDDLEEAMNECGLKRIDAIKAVSAGDEIELSNGVKYNVVRRELSDTLVGSKISIGKKVRDDKRGKACELLFTAFNAHQDTLDPAISSDKVSMTLSDYHVLRSNKYDWNNTRGMLAELEVLFEQIDIKLSYTKLERDAVEVVLLRLTRKRA